MSAEIVRLLRAKAHLAVLPGAVSNALDAAIDDAEGPEAERLRRFIESREAVGGDTFGDIADAIERGEHLSEAPR